jgi:anaerobic ribonucleoside-triphosphate reductase
MDTKKEITTCYKCDAEVEAYVGQVHPLCEKCDESFDDWLQRELNAIERCGK